MKLLGKFAFAAMLVAVSALHMAYAAGSITVYSALEDDEIKTYIKDAKQALPDVDIHVLRLSTGDLAARLIAEANNPHADVVWGVALTNMLDPRISAQFESYDAKGESKLAARYRDPHDKWFAPTGYMASFCVNTVRLKQKHLPMPTSWQDLTKAEYKGEVVMPSPVSSGTGYLQIEAILQALGPDKGWAFLKKLDKNIAQYTSSGSAPCKLARRGEYAVGASFAMEPLVAIKLGYPIKMVIPSEWVGYELEGTALMKASRNKADAKRFIDWTLTPDAAKLYGKYRAIVTIPGFQHTKALTEAGMTGGPDEVLYPVDFEKSARDRKTVLKKWQTMTKR